MTDKETKVLVVDDEPNIRFFLKRVLTRDGHQVTAVESGEEALNLVQAEEFDLALLDLKLKGIGGMDVLERLHHYSPGTAVIVLTGYASLDTAVEALRHGAHDYLFKPAKTVELRQSVRTALLKRQRDRQRQALISHLERSLSSTLEEIRSTASSPVEPRPPEPLPELEMPTDDEGRFLRRGPWRVDMMRHIITLDGQLLELTPTEFDLLAYMVGEAPRVISHQELVAEVQGYESEPWEASDTVRYHVYNIRSKLKDATGRTGLIRTVRGVGYAVDNKEINA
jgi:DNA-binding response OmpR family regulator